MTDTEIFAKAIKKAKSNGFTGKDWDPDQPFKLIIFSHEFAKAFWGAQRHDWGEEQPICSYCNMEGSGDVWQGPHCWSSNLQQMVLEEDPIKYLEKFI